MHRFLPLLFLVAACGGEKAAPTAPSPEANLRRPQLATETAPATFRVRFETTKGDFVVEAVREWAPNGVDRFYNLVRVGYFGDVVFFRAIKNFMVQFGIHGDPEVSAVWKNRTIPDDPVVESNRRGYVTFAKKPLPDSRTTQMFINFQDNRGLDGKGFSPIGKVVEGMDVVDKLYTGYGDRPDQRNIQARGNAYLKESFPELDSIERAVLLD